MKAEMPPNVVAYLPLVRRGRLFVSAPETYSIEELKIDVEHTGAVIRERHAPVAGEVEIDGDLPDGLFDLEKK